MTAPRLGPGQVVAGRYSIRALLGYGGATAAYVASLEGRDVVVKLFAPQLAGRGDVLGALQQAAVVTNSLPAETTAPILESGFDPQTGAPFMVQDLVPFPSLAQALSGGGALPLTDVVVIVRGMARAVDAAHAQRFAHGGLKPRNVFVGLARERPVRVIDFGVSIARGALPTGEGYALAAPWLAPEQLQGRPGGPTMDVFSAALVAFFAATGRSYWRSCQGAQPDLAGWQQEITSPRAPASVRARELGVTVGPAFDAALGRALALNPSDRFGSLGELADALAKGEASQKMAMTMPLDAMPLADLQRMRQAHAPPAPQHAGGDTLAIPSPVEASPPQWQPAPPAQPMPPAAPVYEPGAAAVVAQPSWAPGAHPPESVALPQQRTGLYVLLAVVGIFVVAGAVAIAVVLTRARSATTSASAAAESASATTPTPVQGSAAATSAPPASTEAPAPTAPEASAPQPETQDASSDEPALLTIVCMPECDSIAIDDTPIEDVDAGAVAEPMRLAAGPHTLAVGKAAYVSQTRKVTLRPGQKEKATFFLSRPGPAPAKPCGKFLQRCP